MPDMSQRWLEACTTWGKVDRVTTIMMTLHEVLKRGPVVKSSTPLVHDRCANHLTCLLVLLFLYDVWSVAYVRNMSVVLIGVRCNISLFLWRLCWAFTMASRASKKGAEGLQYIFSLHKLSDTEKLSYSINAYYSLLSPFMLPILTILLAHQLNNGTRYRPPLLPSTLSVTPNQLAPTLKFTFSPNPNYPVSRLNLTNCQDDWQV